MSKENCVDARGLSCPEPVLLTMNALDKYGDGAFSVMLSSATSRDNVRGTLDSAGRNYTVNQNGDEWTVEVAAK